MRRSEEALHKAIAAHLRLRLQPPWMFWHTPNGGARSKAEAGILKAFGTRPGIPDLFIAGPARLIAMELKAPPRALPSGRISKAKPRTSEAQDDTIEALAACGIETVVVRTMEEAETQLRALGVPLKGRIL